MTRAVAATLATGLLMGWPLLQLKWASPAGAQQSPDTWSAERRAVLPSGLTVQMEFSPLPGVNVTPSPGKLAERAGTGPAYTDGLRPGDPAESFLVAEQRPRADGSWRTMGDLQISFSRAVRNPRLHVSGLSALATGSGGTTGTASRLTVIGGSPAAPTLVGRTGWQGWNVSAGELSPAGDGTQDGSSDGAGTLELAGTVSTVTLRIEQRSTARSGSTTAPAQLHHAYTVTLDEGLGTAPQGYGNASHVVSDLFLGQDAAGTVRSRPQTVEHPLLPGRQPVPPPVVEQADGPMVELDRGAARRSPWANPAPPQLQPGRGEYQGSDPTLKFPGEAAIGRYYDLEVPVSPGSGPAVLAGWIDFDRNGRFDPGERVQADVPAGATSVTLEWMVPPGATAGETWARLRLGRDGAQLVNPGGFADSGEVVDQRIQLVVGAARPEISAPASGTATAEPRPEFHGEGALAGATVTVLEGDAALCTARAGSDGAWSCRPDNPLAQGPHTLVPVETTKGGMVLRGEPIKLTVKSTPPTAPVFTLPEYTNDPGLLITGIGEPGSTVSVTDGPGGRPGGELCSTAVAAVGSWSCLPVENLSDGKHQLTASAVDAAGNRTDGKPTTLTVDTVAPDKPVLTSPAAGETVRTARPRFTGRAEPAATVTVTARAGAGERAALCSAVVAADGAWSCTAARDLGNGDLTLTATVTDRAGNGTAGDPVSVHIAVEAAGTPSPSPSPSPSLSPTSGATPSPSSSTPTPAPSPSLSLSPSPSPSSSPSVIVPSVSASAPPGALPVVVPPLNPSPTASASPSPPTGPSPSASPSTGPSPSASPSASVSPSARPSPSSARVRPAPRTAPAAEASASAFTDETDARTLAAPPADAAAATQRSDWTGWRSAAFGMLLMLIAVSLVTRRVFGRGSGARRR